MRTPLQSEEGSSSAGAGRAAPAAGQGDASSGVGV